MHSQTHIYSRWLPHWNCPQGSNQPWVYLLSPFLHHLNNNCCLCSGTNIDQQAPKLLNSQPPSSPPHPHPIYADPNFYFSTRLLCLALPFFIVLSVLFPALLKHLSVVILSSLILHVLLWNKVQLPISLAVNSAIYPQSKIMGLYERERKTTACARSKEQCSLQ